MPKNDNLIIHFVNVNHGDAIIIEFPDESSTNKARFGVIDFGAKKKNDRGSVRDYLMKLINVRMADNQISDYVIEFACCTHPHNDHYGGLSRFMKVFSDATNPENNKINAFWDCGFRTNASDYNEILDGILANQHIQFLRLGSGSEFKFGAVRISVLAPSVDLRNRFDTFGIDKNDASIVLKIQFQNSFIILAADAEFASWGKTTEEFPRREEIDFFTDALGFAERHETADQLKCDLLKLSHHGSMHGTSLEYLERINPNRIVITAGSKDWYETECSNWAGMFPHPLISETLKVLKKSLDKDIKVKITGDSGSLIYMYSGNDIPSGFAKLDHFPGDDNFQEKLKDKWNSLWN